MMIIYVIIQSFPYCGDTVRHVFTDKELAYNYVSNINAKFFSNEYSVLDFRDNGDGTTEEI